MSNLDTKMPERIGKYEIASKIGEGGFGTVYKGRDPLIRRTVAVKTCNSDQELIRKRFFREAEIAGSLRHDNIVTLHDFGVHEETPFLVQEFLNGQDLDVLIASNYDKLDMAFKIRCMRAVAEGLRYAHQQGVIHRDIKPANIRVLHNGGIKVMDFGIAKLTDQRTQLTKTGMTLGTVSYLSPEQLRGEQVDHRVDIFSYGVLAYELLCAKKPFEAKSISNLFFKLLHEEAPPVHADDLPPGLGAVVKRCLEKDAADRYSTFDEAITELHEIQVAGGYDGASDSFPGRGVPDVAETVREALRAGELTTAEFSLDLARKQMGDSDEFDRLFGSLQEQLDRLKEDGDHTSGAISASGAISEADIIEVRRRIADGEFEIAESKLIALSAHSHTDHEIEGLWDNLRKARTGTAGELPIHGGGPVNSQWWQSRQNQLLAAGIGGVLVLLMMIVWFAALGSSKSGQAAPRTQGATTEPRAAGSAATPTATTDSVPTAPIAGADESRILKTEQNPAQTNREGEVPIEEWAGDVEKSGDEPPIEEFSGDGSS